MKTRICAKCKKELPLNENYFHINKKYREGFTRECKKCRNEYCKVRAKMTYEERRERIQKYGKRHYQNNKKRYRELNAKWYQEHKLTRNEYYQRYRSSVKGHFNNTRANAKRRGLEFNLTLEEYENITNFSCHYCGENQTSIGLDRIDPAKGYTKDNVLPCCPECNRIRSCKYSVEEMEKIANILKEIKSIHRLS